MKHNYLTCISCPHGKRKYRCAACKTARGDPLSSKRVNREKESSPEIKQEPFTIQGYFGFDKK